MLAVFLVSAVNVFLLFVGVMLAVPGDGRSTAFMTTVAVVGGIGVFASTAMALALCSGGRKEAGLRLSLMTIPAMFLGAVALIVGSEVYKRYAPMDAALAEACRSAGPQYLAKPAAPVRSIAYDWEERGYPPNYLVIERDGRGNTTGAHSGTMYRKFPAQIAFLESRCCRDHAPVGRRQTYIRVQGDRAEYIPELTSDALVTFRTTRKEMPGESRDLVTIDMEVSDRRDGRKLATMRYVLSGKRGCGETGQGVMNETAFVARAVGL